MAWHTVYTSDEQRDRDNTRDTIKYQAQREAWMNSPEREALRVSSALNKAAKIRNIAERREYLRKLDITPHVFLSLSPAMRHEWHSRCIGDAIQGLAEYSGQPAVTVDESTAREIAADCRHYIDPRAIDASPAERAAYRALLRQIEKQLA